MLVSRSSIHQIINRHQLRGPKNNRQEIARQPALAHLQEMKRALPGGGGMPVLFRHRPKYSLRGYPLFRSNGGLHHVVQEARVGCDAVRLLKKTQHSANRERAARWRWFFLVQKCITSDKISRCGCTMVTLMMFLHYNCSFS